MASIGQGLGGRMQSVLIVALVALVFASAVSVIFIKHKTRQYFAELQNLQRASEDAHVEWSQLLVEQGTWASDARVDRAARQRLNMMLPQPQEVVVLAK
ncbi:MAG: cell division protein FtsL [Candidatus Berkiella sp.]